MGIKYWYKSQEESSIWEDISSQISKDITGSNTINNVPSEFEFQVSPFVKSGNTTIFSGILINIGDKVLVTQDESQVIAFGTVFNNDPELLGWDRKNNIPYQRFNVKAEEDDFSSSIIDKFEYTDTAISSILNEIMLYTDESLNNAIGKYILNIEDYNIAFSLEKKTPREALTELCEQIDCFWILKTSLIPDDTEIFKIYRYIEISSRSGIVPEIDSDWYDGIQNKHVRDGKIENPITENRSSISYIAAESNFKIDSDKSMIVNYIDLSCKVYESDSSTTYVRSSNIPALPGVFDYQIDGYADDIKYIAIQIKTNVLAGSTNTIVRVPSNRAANNMMVAGNKVYFEDSLDAYEEASFFEILSVTKINDTYTEIEFDTLPFTPGPGDKFEVISNVDIYRSENDINYSTKGVSIDCDKKSYAKIKFLPLSEPPSGQNITVIYTKCIDYTYTNKNDESIAKNGLKYKEIKIDDSITLTRSELENLASKLLTLNPVYKFNVSSRRYGLVPIGLAISVRITNYITETFILNENSFEYLGANDRNKKPSFIQNLTFSTQIGRPDKLIEKLQQQKKKTASNAENLSKNKQIESIKIQDYITWSFNPLSGVEDTSFTPPTPTFDSIVVNDADSFTINYTPATGVNVYRIDVSVDSDFSTKISGYNNKGIFRSGTWTVNGLAETGATTVYLRMRALSYDNVYSSYSSTETIILVANDDLVSDSNTTVIAKFNGNYTNENVVVGDLSGVNSPSFTTPLLSGDTNSLQLDGINQVVIIPSGASTSRDISVRALFKYLSFTRTDTYLYSEWYGQALSSNYIAKIIIEYDKSNNRFLISLYDEGYGAAPNNDKCVILATSTITLNTTNKNLIQFTWDNTNKIAEFAINKNNLTLTQDAGSLSLATINVNDSIAPRIIYWGGFTYPDALYASLSPNMVLGRLFVDSVKRTFAQHETDYDNISSRL